MNGRLAVLGIALAFTLSVASAPAEIRKLMQFGDGKLTPSFELVLTPPKDWVEDKAASRDNGVQVMVPRGKTFGNAPAVMYVKVSSRPDSQSVEDFVRVSQERWRGSVRDTKIERIADVGRANGQPTFVSYRYENPSRPQQRFEAVSFAIDKDNDGNSFFVMVALTGREKKAIDRAMAPYNAFLKQH